MEQRRDPNRIVPAFSTPPIDAKDSNGRLACIAYRVKQLYVDYLSTQTAGEADLETFLDWVGDEAVP